MKPPAPPDLDIVLSARPDGSVVLRCTRADGTATWQRQDGPRARFFPFHDLTHFAVETVLGARDGFFGLIAAGWDIADTGGKGARGPLPHEAVVVEHLVGLVEGERVGGAAPLTAAELLAQLATLATSGRIAHVPALTDAQLDEVRRRREELHAQWAATPAGAELRLAFARPAASGLRPG